MSETEINKGLLVPHPSQSELTQEEIDELLENGDEWMMVNDVLYRVKYEIERQTEPYFSQTSCNGDGSINFFTMHYNGGSLQEVIEESLTRKKK
jgi:hypothetical protein